MIDSETEIFRGTWVHCICQPRPGLQIFIQNLLDSMNIHCTPWISRHFLYSFWSLFTWCYVELICQPSHQLGIHSIFQMQPNGNTKAKLECMQVPPTSYLCTCLDHWELTAHMVAWGWVISYCNLYCFFSWRLFPFCHLFAEFHLILDGYFPYFFYWLLHEKFGLFLPFVIWSIELFVTGYLKSQLSLNEVLNCMWWIKFWL